MLDPSKSLIECMIQSIVNDSCNDSYLIAGNPWNDQTD